MVVIGSMVDEEVKDNIDSSNLIVEELNTTIVTKP